MPCGPAETSIKLQATNFTMARMGCHLFWHMSSLYSALGMSQFGGRSYMWLNHQWSKWETFIQRKGFAVSKHLIKPAGEGESAPKPLDETADFRSASTLALLALLCQWCWAPDARGGVRDPTLREASLSLLNSFVDIACKGGAFVLGFGTVVADINPWPRPFDVCIGAESFAVEVSTQGMVELQPLISATELPATSVFAQKLLAEIGQLGRNDDRTSLTTFIKACWNRSRSLPVWDQVVSIVAWRADKAICGRHGVVDPRVARSDFVDKSETRLLRSIGEYIEQGKRSISSSFHQWPMISGTCDESNIRSLNLYSTALVCPDNTAFWCPPQALVGLSPA